MKKQENFLIHKLRLVNFMLHKETELDLTQSPITLITGANGSGKTQVLDGLILALGYSSRRLKKTETADLVAPFGDKAEVSLDMSLSSSFNLEDSIISEEIMSFLETLPEKTWRILVEIHPQKGIDYFFVSPEKKIKVRRKTVRELFRHLAIKADNRLAFTEEGTVNVFADHSSKNKLELFLETTGLATYRENLVSSWDSIEKASRAIDPLRRKLSLEKEYLQSMEKTRALMEKKAALIDEHFQLVIEEAWSGARIAEKEASLLEKRLQNRKKEAKSLKKELLGYEEEKKELDQAIIIERKQQDEMRRVLEKQGEKLGNLEGQNSSNKRILEENQKKKEEFEEKIHSLEENKLSPQEEKKISKRIGKIEEELSKIKEIQQTTGEDFFSPSLAQERKLLGQAIRFRHLLEKEKITCVGPLFYELKIKPDAPINKQGLERLLGIHAFSFIASSQKDYQAASEVFQKEWPSPSEAPAFFIAKSSLPKNYSPSTAAGDVSQSLQAPKNILYFLEKVMKVSIFSDGSTNCDFEKSSLTWHKEKIHLPWPAVGNGWSFRILSEGRELSLEKLEKAIHAQEIHENLNQEKEDLLEKARAQDDQKQEQLKERVQEFSAEIESLKQEIASIEKNYAEVKSTALKQKRKYELLLDSLREKSQREDVIQDRISRLKEKKENEEATLSSLEISYEEKKSLWEEVAASAKKLGECPEKVRTLQKTQHEKAQLEARLEVISISPISDEVYNAQKEKVRKLDEELTGTEAHIEELKSDMERRFADWYKQVTVKINELSQSMNYLLTNVTHGVRLRVENIKNPEKAGLHIEVQRHGKKWLDLSSLSGGEKVLTVEALILSLHLQTDSPLHAIDECTQRLDLQFKAMAFEMVQRAVEEAIARSKGPHSPQFFLLAPDTLGVEFDEKSETFFKRVVLAPGKTKKMKKKVPVKIAK